LSSTVLVVDDSDTVRMSLRHHLEGAGYQVREAAHGQDALALARSAGPDVVLLDLEMPGIDGREILAVFQREEMLASIPVVVVSSHRRVHEVVESMEAGAHDFLAKPFEPAELLARVRAAARVKALNDELRRRNHELELFAQRASHDLKSPLSVMKGMAETLVAQGDALDPALRVRLLERISAAADRASQMVTDLLALALNGTPSTVATPGTDLQPVVEELTGPELLFDAVVEISGELGMVAAPRPDVVGVLFNLIDNASHYGRSADGVLRLHVAGEGRDGVQTVSIRDRGAGIPEPDRANLFQPFHRGESSLVVNPTSTGIGLAIVARATARWGGSATFETGSEGGACFVIRLPLAPGDDQS